MPSRVATAFAPGRANLIGEHTDYNDGLSLPFALGQGITVHARASTSPELTVDAGDRGIARIASDRPVARFGDWRDFVRGTCGELVAAGVAVPGAELRITGDLPDGAGLSSSAALGVALSLALLGLAGESEPDRVWLAKLCSRVENDWVGAPTGLLDQLASLLGQPGHALRIDFRTLSVEPVALELGDWRLVVLDSGESHNLADSGYGERRRECEAARERLGLESLRDATESDLAALPDPLASRVRHVIEENERVEATVRALRNENLETVGELLDASHASLRDLYASSTDAVEATVKRLKHAGAAGARMMGGGFGGSVLALLAPDAPAQPGAIELEPAAGAALWTLDAGPVAEARP